MSDRPDIPASIRSFCAADLPACRTLYVDGHIGGQQAANDMGFDIDDIDAAYMKHRGSHFWVAQAPNGEVVGMIGVQQHEAGEGEIRRLRVRQDWRRKGIGSALMETALQFCQSSGHVKVTLDTYMDREPAIRLFEKFRFRLARTRKISGRDLSYFYLDLYAGEDRREHPEQSKSD